MYTLNTLESFNKNFVDYLLAIIKALDEQKWSPKKIIRSLAYGLHLLSYENVGQQNANGLSGIDWVSLADKRTDEIKALISNEKRFSNNVEAFFKDSKYGKRYSSKRVWCSLRDYVKSPKFSAYFKEALLIKNVDDDIIKAIFSEESRQTIELPGDVWNNNSTFRNCLFQISGTKDKDGEPFNRQLRKIYEHQKITVGYPEQFDVTFDFVPRMCEKHLCKICPFKAAYEVNHIGKICVNNIAMLCPISLASCGYITKCRGNECSLRKLLALNKAEVNIVMEVIPVVDLEKKFSNDMENICHAASKLGYNPTYFWNMIKTKGGYQAAKQLIHTKNPSSGLTRLWELGHLELSLEAHAIKPEYESLFTEDERRICSERLESFGYKIMGG
jgi:hypothetical protein